VSCDNPSTVEKEPNRIAKTGKRHDETGHEKERPPPVLLADGGAQQDRKQRRDAGGCRRQQTGRKRQGDLDHVGLSS